MICEIKNREYIKLAKNLFIFLADFVIFAGEKFIGNLKF